MVSAFAFVLIFVVSATPPSDATRTAPGQRTAPIRATGKRPRGHPVRVDPFDRLETVQTLGREIAAQDEVSATATDVALALERRQPLPPLGGWITVRDGIGWKVRFLRKDLPEPTSGLDLSFTGPRPEIHIAPAEGLPLAPEQAAMWRARQLALRTSPPRCGNGVNPVVIEASLVGRKGWLVYLLNPATRRNEIVIGGHTRVEVSSDGRTVLASTPLSVTCLTLDGAGAPAGAQTVGAWSTQVDGDVPHETAVSESLRTHLPLFVGTQNRKVWEVSDGTITEVHRP